MFVDGTYALASGLTASLCVPNTVIYVVLTQIANKSWLYWEPRKIFHLLTPSFLLPWSHHSSLRHLVSSSLVFMTINYGFPPRLFDSSAV